MPYVQRDKDHNIVAVMNQSSGPDCEEIAADHSDIDLFLERVREPEESVRLWRDADIALARVIEDLVDILIEKKLLKITDFPLAAQQKLVSRHGRRKDYAYLTQLFPVDEDEDLAD